MDKTLIDAAIFSDNTIKEEEHEKTDIYQRLRKRAGKNMGYEFNKVALKILNYFKKNVKVES